LIFAHETIKEDLLETDQLTQAATIPGVIYGQIKKFQSALESHLRIGGILFFLPVYSPLSFAPDMAHLLGETKFPPSSGGQFLLLKFHRLIFRVTVCAIISLMTGSSISRRRFPSSQPDTRLIESLGIVKILRRATR
jgi:hypothetical protein